MNTQSSSAGTESSVLVPQNILLALVFSTLLLYEALGIFPIAPMEGDGLGIANGATEIAQIGVEDSTLAYRYSVQTGTYALTIFLHRLTDADALTVLSLLSALASVVFVYGTAGFLSRVTAYPFALCGVVLLLFQETFTSGYYGNSTVLAAAFLALALWVAAQGSSFYALLVTGFLLGLAAWMRFDVVVVAPALLLILHRGAWQATFTRTAVVALVSVVVALGGIYLSGSNMGAILGEVVSHRGVISTKPSGDRIPLLDNVDLRSYVAFLPVVMGVLMCVGVFRLLRKRGWLTLGICLLGMAPFLTVYTGTITTPKYLYYLIPFMALLVLSALPELGRAAAKRSVLNNILLLGVVALFIGQYVVGWEIRSSSRPNQPETSPDLVTLFSFSTPLRQVEQVSAVIGTGSALATADGRRLLSGILFAPLFQSDQKRLMRAEVDRINDYFAELGNEELAVVTTQYTARQLLLNVLLAHGYSCHARDDTPGEFLFFNFSCHKQGHEILLVSREIVNLPPNEVERAIDELLAFVPTTHILYVSTNPQEQARLLERAAQAQQINSYAYEMELRR